MSEALKDKSGYWREQWYGSDPLKGAAIWKCTKFGTSGDLLFHIGPGKEHLELARKICAEHNATLDLIAANLVEEKRINKRLNDELDMREEEGCHLDDDFRKLDRQIVDLQDQLRWRSMQDAPKDGTIINAIARYPNATAGFPRYIGWCHDLNNWVEYSRTEPAIVVPWAWRSRGDWPREEDFVA
jgi:hypothetical protein